jgi:hypothetical protein
MPDAVRSRRRHDLINHVAGAADRALGRLGCAGTGKGANRVFALSVFIFITEKPEGHEGPQEGCLGTIGA